MVAGAHFHDTITSCVKASEAVITMVGYPSDVEECIWVRTASFRPLQTHAADRHDDLFAASGKMLYAHGKARSLAVLDAPVTGGDSGASRYADDLVGGEKAAYGGHIRCLGDGDAHLLL
ncbi:MAG: NAD(P)-binding domain-containing protein [Merdibacter sp.]